MAAENYDRPRPNQKKDNAESSKQKGQKRKGEELVAAAERSRPPQPPRTDDFAKVMESICLFHPKGKNSVKDCYSLKDYVVFLALKRPGAVAPLLINPAQVRLSYLIR